VAIAAGAALLVAASATYLGVTLTSKIENGSFFACRVEVASQTAPTEWESCEPSVAIVAGKRLQLAVSVRNPGRVPITLEALPFDTPNLAVDDMTVMAHATRNPNLSRLEMAEPFHPVEVDTHDEAIVWLMLRVTDAFTPISCGGYWDVVQVQVRYRVLGMQREQWITLPKDVTFRTPCAAST
jgi:hypothetical protein